MSKPVLTYFGIRGRDAPARMCLALAGVDYDFVVHDFEGFGAELKPKAGTSELPFGQLPIFKTQKGVTLAGSVVIARHIARRNGMYGETDGAVDTIEMIMEGTNNLWIKFIEELASPSGGFMAPEVDEAAAKTFVEKYIDPKTIVGSNGGGHFAMLERFIKKPDAYVSGTKVTIGDICLADTVMTLRNIEHVGKTFIEAYPKAVQYCDFILEKHDVLQQYYDQYEPKGAFLKVLKQTKA